MPPYQSSPADPRIILYGRAGCHLCEEATELLDAIVGREGYRTIDIDADDELLVRYGHRIPVVSVDGAERLEGVITGPDLRRLLQRST